EGSLHSAEEVELELERGRASSTIGGKTLFALRGLTGAYRPGPGARSTLAVRLEGPGDALELTASLEAAEEEDAPYTAAAELVMKRLSPRALGVLGTD